MGPDDYVTGIQTPAPPILISLNFGTSLLDADITIPGLYAENSFMYAYMQAYFFLQAYMQKTLFTQSDTSSHASPLKQ